MAAIAPATLLLFIFKSLPFEILISIFSNSKIKSLLILKSRYKNNYKNKLIERIFGKIFFNQCLIIDRRLRYSQNNSIHQTKVMMELVTKNGLDLNDEAEIKKIFDLKY